MSLSRLWIAVVLVILSRSTANAGEIEDRIAEYLAVERQVYSSMSVLIHRSSLSQFFDEKMEENISGSECWQRLIICRDTNEIRMDGRKFQYGASGTSEDAQLIAGDECLYWQSIILKPSIERIEMKAGRPMKVTTTRRVDPFSLLGGNCVTAFGEDLYSNIFHEKFEVVEEYPLKDGRYRAYLVPNDLGAWEVTFAKEPTWAPVQFRMFSRDSFPKPKGKLDGETITKWNLVCTTTTEWQRIDDEPDWLPSRITMECETQRLVNLEFLLTDWKLGKDVDRSPLQKSQFTPQNIPKQIDFDKVAAAFDEMRAKKKK
jgi:hypothetical protein